MTLNKIKELPEGEIVILLDTDTSLENVKRAAGSKGWKVVDLQAESEDYRLVIGKQA
jgi:tRNA 2-thiouridine synthesizing protein A